MKWRTLFLISGVINVVAGWTMISIGKSTESFVLLNGGICALGFFALLKGRDD